MAEPAALDTPLASLGKLAMSSTARALDNALPGGSYYYSQMNKDTGLAICVKGKGKTMTHGLIHESMDKAEANLGAKGNPQYTASLGEMENAAAESIGEATGCDKEKLKSDLRSYHENLGLDSKTKLRADPFGKNTTASGKDPIFGTGKTGSVGF